MAGTYLFSPASKIISLTRTPVYRGFQLFSCSCSAIHRIFNLNHARHHLPQYSTVKTMYHQHIADIHLGGLDLILYFSLGICINVIHSDFSSIHPHALYRYSFSSSSPFHFLEMLPFISESDSTMDSGLFERRIWVPHVLVRTEGGSPRVYYKLLWLSVSCFSVYLLLTMRHLPFVFGYSVLFTLLPL